MLNLRAGFSKLLRANPAWVELIEIEDIYHFYSILNFATTHNILPAVHINKMLNLEQNLILFIHGCLVMNYRRIFEISRRSNECPYGKTSVSLRALLARAKSCLVRRLTDRSL